MNQGPGAIRRKELLKRILKITAVAFIYYGCARFGLGLALGNTNASPVWPPSGFAFAALLLLGYRVWPGILIGAFAANVAVFAANKAADMNTILLISAFIATGNTFEALAGFKLLNFFRARRQLSSMRDYTYFIFAAMLMCTVSCTVGVTSLLSAKIIPANEFKTVWFTWWMGDLAGIIVLTPVLISWWQSLRSGRQMRNMLKFSIILVCVCIYLVAVFNGWLNFVPQRSSVYLLLVILAWSVFSLEQWQSSVIVIAVSAFAVWNTLSGKGPFISATQNESLLVLQIFLCACATTMMFLSATLKERQQSEEKLTQANDRLEKAKKQLEESMHVKEQFLANMSHEIRTPMNAVVGFTELISKTNLDEEQKKYVNMVRASGQNLLVIINDILDFSKIQSGKIVFEQTPINLEAVVSSIFTLMLPRAETKRLMFSCDIEKNIPAELIGDPTRLSQVLINLADNAIKFTAKGEVKISVHLLSENEKNVLLRFDVMDTGIGIPPERLDSVFEVFMQVNNETTRKFGGTGLGLAIVKQLVELQKGSVSVKSRPGEGSVFSFSLSFRKNTSGLSTQLPVAPEQTTESIEGIHVLVVEDDKVNQMLMQKMLDDLKCTIDFAEDGRIAEEKAAAKDYDIILMDVQLPEIDGREVTQFIRKKLPLPRSGVPIIAVTSYAMSGEADKCMRAGMNDYLAKPFSKNTLYNKIRTHLRRREPETAK